MAALGGVNGIDSLGAFPEAFTASLILNCVGKPIRDAARGSAWIELRRITREGGKPFGRQGVPTPQKTAQSALKRTD